uniref:Uncharacterized protein n=1 Tax=Populus alba TaxID=43335 RepID=A0A4U5Q8P4_POPAL|nr:hypothetical protein D5086_0000132040 [Populus alba]
MILEIGAVFINSEFDDHHGDDDNDDEQGGGGRSLDLLVKFVSNVFKKVSKRARKAVRSVLPVPLSTKLVEFSVNGVLLPAFLWVLKAFLEVILEEGISLTLWHWILAVLCPSGIVVAPAGGTS